MAVSICCNAISGLCAFSATFWIRMLMLIWALPSIFRASTISGARDVSGFVSLPGGSFPSDMGALSMCLTGNLAP